MSRNAISANPEHYLFKIFLSSMPWTPLQDLTIFLGINFPLPQTKNPILHSHQKLNCLKSGVSYSSTVSLPINQEKSTPLFRQLKFWCEYRTRQNPARLITEVRFPGRERLHFFFVFLDFTFTCWQQPFSHTKSKVSSYE